LYSLQPGNTSTIHGRLTDRFAQQSLAPDMPQRHDFPIRQDLADRLG
jgi:hypothetical protein